MNYAHRNAGKASPLDKIKITSCEVNTPSPHDGASSTTPISPLTPGSQYSMARFEVLGMTCKSCVANIEVTQSYTTRGQCFARMFSRIILE